MATHLLGIRHHGPGSARAVKKALEQINPDIVLIEGPPEGHSMIQYIGTKDLVPPVALLCYDTKEPSKAVFYPFAEFSPEYQALLYVVNHQKAVDFFDCPLSHKFAIETLERQKQLEIQTDNLDEQEHLKEPLINEELSEPISSKHPLGGLAEIDGYTDWESWWDHHFEISNHDPLEAFQAVLEGMVALREQAPQEDEHTLLREAFMRTAIRTAQSKHKTIAVVCGAWHSPALLNLDATVKTDVKLLKSLPKTVVDATWIPWTNSRLGYESGYGAGIQSPGWYEHLWQFPNDDGVHWLSKIAQVFRANKLDVSSAHIIETQRLVQHLTALRGMAQPDLNTYKEAVISVMCMGDAKWLDVVIKQLIVGERMGVVKGDIPQLPLQKDFDATVKRLKLKLLAEAQERPLDLRKASDLEKSKFFHSLHLLDIPWATLLENNSLKKGTFNELWSLCWSPELNLKIVEAAVYGTTVLEALEQYLCEKASTLEEIGSVAQLLGRALLTDSSRGTLALLEQLDNLSSLSSDTKELLLSLPPLLQTLRYGNVRTFDLEFIKTITERILTRACLGLPHIAYTINTDSAEGLVAIFERVDNSLKLSEQKEFKAFWIEHLQQLLSHEENHPLIKGLVSKLLLTHKAIEQEHVAQWFSQTLSFGTPPQDAALWIQGFLRHSASFIIYDSVFFELIHEWIKDLEYTTLIEVLPLLRRTFSDYTSPEKQQILNKAKTVASGGTLVVSAASQDRIWEPSLADPIADRILEFLLPEHHLVNSNSSS